MFGMVVVSSARHALPMACDLDAGDEVVWADGTPEVDHRNAEPRNIMITRFLPMSCGRP